MYIYYPLLTKRQICLPCNIQVQVLSLYSLAEFMSSAAHLPHCCCLLLLLLRLLAGLRLFCIFSAFRLGRPFSFLYGTWFCFVLFAFRFCFWNINDALLLLLSLCITFAFECFCLHFMCVCFTYILHTHTNVYINVCAKYLIKHLNARTSMRERVLVKTDKLEAIN